MEVKKITYLIGLAAALLMTGCTKEIVVADEGQGKIIDDPTGTPVLFTVGNVNSTSTTRADVIPYMAKDGRFICSMYYHAKDTDNDSSYYDIKAKSEGGTMTTAWLQVNNKVGNSVYRKSDFSTPTNTDTYDFDKDATIFYWQNRLKHAFLALTDYHKLTSGVLTGVTSTDMDKLKMYPNYDKDFVTVPEDATEKVIDSLALSNNRYAVAYNLTRTEGMDTIADQPDPILALTVMKPTGATQEANRVRLYFKHQFSQIQVNIKSSADNSTEIKSDQIDSVQLLGVADTAYVCCRLNQNGTVGDPVDKPVNKDIYSDEHLENNQWGTSFKMFDLVRPSKSTLIDVDDNGIDDRYALGFLKSFNAIAFGYLWAIRITWHENGGVKHVLTYEVPQTSEIETDKDEPSSDKEIIHLRDLQSGMKYIYDLELRRGTLAVIRTKIVDWKQEEALVYETSGTISE